MKLYGGMDLHANNCVISIIDDTDKVHFERRLPNDLGIIKEQMCAFQADLTGLVVESTYNWYWLVDGLMDAGYELHLANTAAVVQYEGLKHTNDYSDARWLARLLRLELLPTGYIYPKDERAVRDLLRKRSQLVRYRTAQILSVQNLLTRNTSKSMCGNDIKKLSVDQLSRLLTIPEQAIAANANLTVLHTLSDEIKIIEKAVRERVKPRPETQRVKTVPGVGDTLGWTILLETGEISRFAKAGNYASYCRCVQSRRMSNGKKKGENNRKNGNKYLAWAYVEAAHHAVRSYPQITRFYQRKRSKTNNVIAIKAIAHKLARATYHVLKDGESFAMDKAFS